MSSLLLLGLPLLLILCAVLAYQRWVPPPDNLSPEAPRKVRALSRPPSESQLQQHHTFSLKLAYVEDNLQQLCTETSHGHDRGVQLLLELKAYLVARPHQITDINLRDRALCQLAQWNLFWGFFREAEDCLTLVVGDSERKKALRRQLLRADRLVTAKPPATVRPIRVTP
ncbi:TPA: hypothetical protein DEP96_03635 [Candidatus Uhrbacteria bacterium]|nr:hypothetical protein [Candidatus Uhrbacteria bacterium]